jgi:hypothetical protein
VPGDDLQHAGVCEALQHFGVVVLLALLGCEERVADGAAHLDRHGRQVGWPPIA